MEQWECTICMQYREPNKNIWPIHSSNMNYVVFRAGSHVKFTPMSMNITLEGIHYWLKDDNKEKVNGLYPALTEQKGGPLVDWDFTFPILSPAALCTLSKSALQGGRRKKSSAVMQAEVHLCNMAMCPILPSHIFCCICVLDSKQHLKLTITIRVGEWVIIPEMKIKYFIEQLQKMSDKN